MREALRMATDPRSLQLRQCDSEPFEQYEAHSAGKLVAFIRIGFGQIRVDVPNWGGETVYESAVMDVDDFAEHSRHIGEARRAVARWLDTRGRLL